LPQGFHKFKAIKGKEVFGLDVKIMDPAFGPKANDASKKQQAERNPEHRQGRGGSRFLKVTFHCDGHVI
jgi:hypothetical protein